MPIQDSHISELFDELKPGDRIEVEHGVAEDPKRRVAKTTGLVVRTERGRPSVNFRGTPDAMTLNNVILLELPDGELTTVTVDDSTVLRRA